MAVTAFADLVRMTVTVGGTGTLTLGIAVDSFRTLSAAGVADGTYVKYAIADSGYAPTGREQSWGIVGNGGTTLTRNLIASNTGSLLNVSTNAHVFLSPSAEDILNYPYTHAVFGGL